MRPLRERLKHVLEGVAVSSGLPASTRVLHRTETLILAYHNVVPGDAAHVGDRSLHIRQRHFAQQLDSLRKTHTVVPLRALFGPSSSSRPRAVITFDDAYLGALTAGIEELRQRDLPATVFVAPAFLGGRSFWWDVAAGAQGLAPTLRERALGEARGQDAAVRRLTGAHCAADSLPPCARCGTLDDLARALEYPALTLGSHTWSHPNLTRLDDGELADELTRPAEWLAQFGERVVPAVTYPYGLADARVQQAARSAGYRAGLLISGGWTAPPIDGRFDVPRLNIPAGVSRDGFVLRASGILS